MSDEGKTTRDIIQDFFKRGDYTGWFDVVYRAAIAGQGDVPWAAMHANPELVSWFEARQQATSVTSTGQRAIVVGCGLGDDAEYLAQQGYDVVAFDISETAIAQCRQRFPDSAVQYQVADLFHLPDDWRNAFDFVFESRTIQSLPWQLCDDAIRAIANLAKAGGTVLVLCMGREPHQDRRGIPWPLSRAELGHFLRLGLQEENFEIFTDERGAKRFRVTYQK